ncbi:MAG: hypothetical protein CMJ80_17400 [Planctomycetaceae bacterium]|nr:hypothetical protein [Planctomycetaceae bacterium]
MIETKTAESGAAASQPAQDKPSLSWSAMHHPQDRILSSQSPPLKISSPFRNLYLDSNRTNSIDLVEARRSTASNPFIR